MPSAFIVSPRGIDELDRAAPSADHHAAPPRLTTTPSAGRVASGTTPVVGLMHTACRMQCTSRLDLRRHSRDDAEREYDDDLESVAAKPHGIHAGDAIATTSLRVRIRDKTKDRKFARIA
jgi:hypothetical protein